MTSEPAGQDERHPPTIELKATEVPDSGPDPARSAPAGAAAAPDSVRADSAAQPGSDPTEKASPGRRGSGQLIFHAMSATVGAAVAAAIVAGLWIAGIVPPRGATAPSAATAPASAAPHELQELSTRLDKLERAIKNEPTQQAPTARMAAVEAQTKSLDGSLAALGRRLDEVAATSENAAKDAAQSAAQAVQSASDKTGQADRAGVQKSDFDALAGRVGALEASVKGLSDAASHPAASGDDRAARLAVAALALDAAIARGAPYQAELAAVKALGAQQDATAPLERFAGSGVPSAATLSRQLGNLVPILRRTAEPSSGGTTFLARLEANARHLVRITPIQAPEGNAPSAVIARIEADASHADIAAALGDIAALPDAAKPAVADWADQAKARQAALQAGRQISAAALAVLSKPAGQ